MMAKVLRTVAGISPAPIFILQLRILGVSLTDFQLLRRVQGALTL